MNQIQYRNTKHRLIFRFKTKQTRTQHEHLILIFSHQNVAKSTMLTRVRYTYFNATSLSKKNMAGFLKHAITNINKPLLLKQSYQLMTTLD